MSGGRFPELAGPSAGDAHFVQTYSFFGKQSETGQRLLDEMKKRYNLKGPEEIFSPVGTANAYDAMHLLAAAIAKAGSTDGDAIRKALESIEEHKGLIKTYVKPFTVGNHDALGPDDYLMVRFEGKRIVPVN
ncbi:MAG: ABC transporter substrate-binding protein [Burkholderiales bacterium]|nr:ABC transporter substrate-binding protein [Burkholderiales bacterium]